MHNTIMHYVYIMQSIARKRKRSRNITHAKSAAEKRAERKRLESLIHNIKGLVSSKGIQQGNVTAHEGDVMTDAIVYDRDHRNDRTVYHDLYGLDYTQSPRASLSTRRRGLIRISNAHGTLVAQIQSHPSGS